MSQNGNAALAEYQEVKAYDIQFVGGIPRSIVVGTDDTLGKTQWDRVYVGDEVELPEELDKSSTYLNVFISL